VQSVDCDLLVLSYNNESWLGLEELEAMCVARTGSGSSGGSGGGGHGGGENEVATLAFDSARYVGARIGIFDPSGRKVGRVSHLSNQELVVIAGEPALVRHVVEAAGGEDLGATGVTGAASLPASVTAPIAAPEAVAAGPVDRLQQTR
jgi:adenine-specific DNA-methyltransferase